VACCNSLMKINIAVFMTTIYHALGALFILCTPFDLSSVAEGFEGGKMHHPSPTVRYPITA